MIITLIFFVGFVTSSYTQRVDGMQSTLKEDLELDRQLKLANKLPIKSIQTKFGYIVDCIDINNQPAFDHPLLKNHKLQRKPSSQQTKAKTGGGNSTSKFKTFLEKVVCPVGTVPIRRTTYNGLIQAKSSIDTKDSDPEQNPEQLSPGTHVAEVYLKPDPNEFFYGVSGTSSVYNPRRVSKDQTSSAHIWVENGEGDGTNKIYVGWHVHPQLHGDDATYIYSRWTSDNFKNTGCYNLQCPGFVQTSRQMFLDLRVDNTSVYGGLMMETEISISQDAKTKNWWLNAYNTPVGYFPAALFSNMTSADRVGWGGKTTTTKATATPPLGIISPPMGSGYLPDETFHHASYFIHVAYQDQPGLPPVIQPGEFLINTFADRPNCFDVKFYGFIKEEGLGCSLQFGGPGGLCDS